MGILKGRGVIVIVAVVAILSFAPGGFSMAEASDGIAGINNAISFRAGLLSLDVRDVAIVDLLQAISEKTGIDLTAGAGLQGTVTLKLQDATLEEALRQLCDNRALVYRYAAETNSYQIVRAALFARGQTTGMGLPAGQEREEGLSMPLVEGERLTAVKPISSEGQSQENQYDSQGRNLYKPKELLVKFKKGTARGQMDALHSDVGSTVLGTIDSRSLDRVRVREGLSEEEAIGLYRASGIVDYVERHALRYPQETLPNDQNFYLQWALHNTGQTVNGKVGSNDADIDASEAWDKAVDGKEVLIAIIDTGIDYTHPELQNRIWNNPGEVPGNGIDDDQNGFIDDVHGWDFAGSDSDPRGTYGHGTHVAGIIAAEWNNGAGIAGIFPRARLMNLKVADNGTYMEIFDIIDAIDYARARGARIINCSYGSTSTSRSEYEAMVELKNSGILALCAAGNDGLNQDLTDSPTYPAAYAHSTNPAYPPLDNIISVAASDQDDNVAGFSNYGKTSVDVLAPGVNIYSTWLNGAYSFSDGTSMAAPHVAGIAGLLLSQNTALAYNEVKALILENVDPLPPPAADKVITGGRVNAYKALSDVRKPGDLTGDGRIRLDDLIVSLRILTGQAPVFPAGPDADANGDGMIGLEESLFILQWMAGLRGNSPPVLAAIGNKSVVENKKLSFTIWAVDEDGDTLIYSASGLPPGAQFDTATRTFNWTPSYSQGGVYSITFRVNDQHSGSDSETITITVMDTAPVFALADYYPLHVGDRYDYRVNNTSEIRQSSATGNKMIDGIETTVVEQYDGQRGYYSIDRQGLKLYGQYVISTDFTGEFIFETPLLLMQDQGTFGTKTVSSTHFSFASPEYIFHVDLTSVTTILGLEDVTTANGALRDCLKISNEIIQYSYIEGMGTGQTTTFPIDYYWFYRGIGSVKELANGDEYVIHQSYVNGVTENY